MDSDRWLTPPRLAKQLEVKPEVILSWIHARELHAVNMAGAGFKRPRWRIPNESVAEFLQRRMPSFSIKVL